MNSLPLEKSVFYGVFLFFISCLTVTFAQDNNLQKYENQITAEKIKSYIQVFTADSMSGRDVELGGEKKAGNYIANFFRTINLDNRGTDDYHQCFPLFEYNYSCKSSLNNKGITDFVFWGYDTTVQWHHLPVYFAGYHQNIPDSIENHAIIVFAMDIDDMIESIIKLRENRKNNTFLLFFGDDSYTYQYISQCYRSYTSKMFNKKSNIFHIAFRPMLDFDKDLKLFFFNDKTFKEVTGKPVRKAKKEARTNLNMKRLPDQVITNMDFKYRLQTTVKSQTSCNVVGMIEGTTKKDEYVVIGAHYDHLGKDQKGNIYYGADDNASGTVALMSVAEVFSEAAKDGIRPERSILWIAFGSEETGLLGSDYYVQHPVVPIEKTVAMINMDMIGRGEKYMKNGNFVFFENYGKDADVLKDFAKVAGNELDIELKKAPMTQKIIYRFASDHYNFVKKDVPSCVLFTGLHDDYHTPDDTSDKLNYENMEKISKLIFQLSWKIANQ